MQIRMADHEGRIEWFVLDDDGQQRTGGAVEPTGSRSAWRDAFDQAHEALIQALHTQLGSWQAVGDAIGISRRSAHKTARGG
jgi:hypothetical protein